MTRSLLAIAVIAAALMVIPILHHADPVIYAFPNCSTRAEQDNIEYAVVTSSALAGSFQPLVEWRGRLGMRSRLYLLDGEGGILEGSGSDNAEKLYNFVSGLHSRGLNYLLLGGDSEIVPSRYLHAGAGAINLDDQYLSDVYYSCPGIDWDPDGDGRYGSPEDLESIGRESLGFSISVGRVPVNTPEEASRYVGRVIGYESDPAPGNWTSRGILASSLMDCPNILNNESKPAGFSENQGYDAYKDNGWKAMSNRSGEYARKYMPLSLRLTELHDYTGYYGLNYSIANDTLDEASLPENLSEGSLIFTFAGQSFYDHVSPPDGYSLANYYDSNGQNPLAFRPALTYEDTWNLTNGEKLPVVYISSCDSLNFSDERDTDLENLIYAPEGGAICVIGSTGMSWRGEGVDYSLGNWYLLPRFWKSYFEGGMPCDSLYRLKSDYLRGRWDEFTSPEPLLAGLYTYNYLGDPALRGWVGRPYDLTVHIPEDSIFAGGDECQVEVKTHIGVPVYNATVGVYLPESGETFRGYTNVDGVARVETAFSTSGTATITVFKKGYVPESGDVAVHRQPADVRIVPGSIRVDPDRLSEGMDMVVEARVGNIGGTDAPRVEVRLYATVVENGPGEWPEPLKRMTIDLPTGSEVEVNFTIWPSRSWKVITIALAPSTMDVNPADNTLSIPISVNARPSFLPLSPVILSEDPESPVETDLTGSVHDPDGPVLLFRGGDGIPPWIGINETGRILIGPPINWSGVVRIHLFVNDTMVGDEADLTIIVDPINDPPCIVNLLHEYDAYVDRPFSLTLLVVDAEGEEVDINISVGLNFTLRGSVLSLIPYPGSEGIYNMTLTVTDPHGESTIYDVVIKIHPPSNALYFLGSSVHLPDATVGSEYNHTITIGGDLAVNATFSDNSSLFEIDPETGEIRFTPSMGDEGEHWIRITVTSGNTTISKPFFLTILPTAISTDPVYLWILGGILALLVFLIVAVYLWGGPRVEQYGLEE